MPRQRQGGESGKKMRIALIADSHGNLAALHAVPDAIRQQRPDLDNTVAAATPDEGTVNADARRVLYDRAGTVRAIHERKMPHAAWQIARRRS